MLLGIAMPELVYAYAPANLHPCYWNDVLQISGAEMLFTTIQQRPRQVCRHDGPELQSGVPCPTPGMPLYQAQNLLAYKQWKAGQGTLKGKWEQLLVY
jgi:hypothetical protein